MKSDKEVLFCPYLSNMIISSRFRPEMYWRSKSLDVVDSFIEGFSNGIRTFSKKQENEVFPKMAFTTFISIKLSTDVGSHSWHSLLSLSDTSDEERFYQFIDYFEEFTVGYLSVEHLSNGKAEIRYEKIDGIFRTKLPPIEPQDFRLVLY